METPKSQPIEVNLSPTNPQMLILSDLQGVQTSISADRFMDMTQRGMKLEDIFAQLHRADGTMDQLGLGADRREVIEQLYGNYSSAANLRNGTYLVTCMGVDGNQLDSFRLPQADYVALRAGGLSNGQIYGALMEGKVPAERLSPKRDPDISNVVEIGNPREAEVQLDKRITSPAIQGNTLTMNVDGREESIKLSPRELAAFAQGVVPLANIANNHLKLMDIMSGVSQNFESNMEMGNDLLSMRR